MEEEDVQLKGFTYIFDCSGVSLSQLSIWSPAGNNVVSVVVVGGGNEVGVVYCC